MLRPCAAVRGWSRLPLGFVTETCGSNWLLVGPKKSCDKVVLVPYSTLDRIVFHCASSRGSTQAEAGRCPRRCGGTSWRAWTVLGARRGPQCSEDQCGMVLCVVCSESQRAVRACRPERHRRRRRRRSTRFEARRRPGSARAARQRAPDERDAAAPLSPREDLAKREAWMPFGTAENLTICFWSRKGCSIPSIRSDGTIPLCSDSVQQSLDGSKAGKEADAFFGKRQPSRNPWHLCEGPRPYACAG